MELSIYYPMIAPSPTIISESSVKTQLQRSSLKAKQADQNQVNGQNHDPNILEVLMLLF